jgi:hypothetical protein
VRTAKLCDFGLAVLGEQKEMVYTSGSSKQLPIKWMALESLTRMRFTERTDV